MPPKRPLKRRGDDDDRRLNKKAGKNKREITYDTYDEALDGGVEMEEKGERYKDGDKAQRFYERAVELYDKALSFQQTYDAAYNQARVLYTLSTSFLLPPTCIIPLRRSIELCKLATTLTNSPLLRMDVGFNLSQSCSSLSDILEDLDSEANIAEVRELREEARDILQEVMDGQEEYLRATSEDNDVDETEEVVDEIENGADIPAEENSMEVDADGGGDNEGDEEESYETHLPTSSTFIDTVITLVDLHLSLWDSTNEPRTPSEEEQTVVRNILDRASVFATPGRQAELDLLEVKVLLTMDSIVWEIFKGEAKPNMGLEKSLEGAIAALSAILSSLDITPPELNSTVKHEILVTLAETHITTSNRMMFLNPQLPIGPSPLAQQSWYHLSQATLHLNTALELPNSVFTPKEFKPSVLLNLSKISLQRSKLSLVPHETAKKNVHQLMDNSISYAARAAEGLNWKFIRIDGSSSTSSLNTSGGGTLSLSTGGGGSEIPWQNGWENELLFRNITLQQIRNCIYATKTEILSPTDQDRIKYNTGLQKILNKLKNLTGERALNQKDVERFLAEIEDEEGILSDTEKQWWKDVFA
ncbi:uncharacterized protein L201_001714 [Kwoniella dendrophila CBS 6074]|uniref:Uncharacterized protein n=1 Tax=Kwoniella dendrophila CBS 6074 TaxID=1295534 RepID=A0AAX4JQJ2_9TREE